MSEKSGEFYVSKNKNDEYVYYKQCQVNKQIFRKIKEMRIFKNNLKKRILYLNISYNYYKIKQLLL